MLSCAQPRQKPKLTVIQNKKSEEEDTTDASIPIKARLRASGKKKKKKEAQDIGLPVKEPQIVYAPDPSTKKEGMNIKDFRRKYRKRTTILPVYLKKIQENMALKEKLYTKTENDSNNTAQKFRNSDKVNYDTQLLNARKPIYITKSQYKCDHENKKQNEGKKEKLINVDYENEVLNIDRFKVRSKHAEGGEQNRHWYQNPNTVRKVEMSDVEHRNYKVD